MAIDQQEIDRAKELARQGNSKAAIASLSQIIQRDSKNVAAWLTLAQLVEEPERAEYCLNKVLILDPGNREALELLQAKKAEGIEAASGSADLQSEPIDVAARLQPQDPELESEQTRSSQKSEPQSIQEAAEVDSPSPVGRMEAESSLAPVAPAHVEDAPRQPELQHSPTVIDPGSGSIPRSELNGERQTQLPSAAEAATAPLERPTDEDDQGKAGGFNRTDLILAGVTVIAGLVLCSLIGVTLFRNSQQLSESPDEVVQVVYENIRAASREDLAGYMATIHPDSPNYNSTQAKMQDEFATYDLSYQIFIPEMLEQGRNTSVISYELTTRKIRGPAFRDKTVSGEMTLRKHEGEWKIYNQTVDDVQYLN